MSINTKSLLAVCIESARLASCRIREIRDRGQLNLVEKGTGTDSITGRPMRDIQTEADRQSEEIIIACIAHYFPNIKIIGEEGSVIVPADEVSSAAFLPINQLTETILPKSIPSALSVDVADLVVFVDPMDGTSDFVHGHLDCVSVLIGVACRGRPLIGVIHRPFPDEAGECYYGGPTVGVFKDGVAMENFTTAPPPAIITTTKSKHHRVVDRVFQIISESVLRKDGGAGWKCWLVADKVAHAYQYARPGTKRWDILAGDAIISGLGGVVTDACGRKIDYAAQNVGNEDPSDIWNNSWGIIASAQPEWHFATLVPACRQALIEAATDPEFKQWPHGLTIPHS
jgi:fructose-1,6-bisphosphatase/inositol monophosphatase family enzyme